MKPSSMRQSGESESSMSEYAIQVGGPTVRYEYNESDETLASDLEKTVGWIEESKAEYEELAPKIVANDGWFARNGEDHPKYAQYAAIFNDQLDRSAFLLDRLNSLRELGIGELDRMSGDGRGRYRPLRKRFEALEAWVRETRNAVAEASGEEF